MGICCEKILVDKQVRESDKDKFLSPAYSFLYSYSYPDTPEYYEKSPRAVSPDAYKNWK